MLVVKRKIGESILIGDNIEIIISEISQDKVQIAINAPKEIIITRKELVETCEFNKLASENVDKICLRDIKSQLNSIKRK